MRILMKLKDRIYASLKICRDSKNYDNRADLISRLKSHKFTI